MDLSTEVLYSYFCSRCPGTEHLSRKCSSCTDRAQRRAFALFPLGRNSEQRCRGLWCHLWSWRVAKWHPVEPECHSKGQQTWRVHMVKACEKPQGEVRWDISAGRLENDWHLDWEEFILADALVLLPLLCAYNTETRRAGRFCAKFPTQSHPCHNQRSVVIIHTDLPNSKTQKQLDRGGMQPYSYKNPCFSKFFDEYKL